jgi:predicted aspartyl protease
VSLFSQIYDNAYSPAAPVADVAVRAFGRSTPEVEVTALVDSGADGTLIPIDVLQQIKAPYWGTRRMFGVAGGSQRVDLYSVTLRVGQEIVYGIHAVAAGVGTEAILGRDVLNQLRITLDGPAETLEIDM